MKKQSTILYILIAVVLAIALGVVFIASPSEIDTVPVILPPASSGDDESDSSGRDDDAAEIIAVTADSVQTVIRTLSRADSYSRTICAESFWSGGESRQNIDVWVRSDATKLAISRADGESTKHVLIIGDEKWIWYSGSTEVYHGEAAEVEADRYQSLMSYEHILELDKSAISDAGFAEYQGEMCIYVRYTSGQLGYENICYVSVASGLVIGEESYDGDSLIYRMSSTSAEYVTPADSVFELPD